MGTLHYWRQYNVLRRNAKEWNIDYTRYTHAQLRYAMELNKGIADATLRLKLLGMPPVNAYLAAISSEKEERHEPHFGTAIKKAAPVLGSELQSLYVSPRKASREAPSFSLPAPKEASPWASVSL